MGVPVLWQYNFSNFNEKARWALDHKRVAHRRRSLVPGLPRAMWFSLRGTLPVLDLEGRRIVDTTAIIAELEALYPEQALYPADPAQRARALELEDYFDEHAGHDVRRAFFWEIRDNRAYLADFLTIGQPAPARQLMALTLPLGWQYVKRRYSFDAAAAARSVGQLSIALDRIEAERTGGEYLVGDRFSVADLTAAALMFPLAWPRELQYRYPDPPALEILDELADHPAVGWITETYQRHRGSSMAVA